MPAKTATTALNATEQLPDALFLRYLALFHSAFVGLTMYLFMLDVNRSHILPIKARNFCPPLHPTKFQTVALAGPAVPYLGCSVHLQNAEKYQADSEMDDKSLGKKSFLACHNLITSVAHLGKYHIVYSAANLSRRSS